jgi:predicted transcriptional regulator of viral defense system
MGSLRGLILISGADFPKGDWSITSGNQTIFGTVNIVPLWNDIDMPRSRFDELLSLAEEHDGLVTADQARHSGFTDSVLARLAQRGRIERVSRGVYRLPYFPPNRFSQYHEVVLWAMANCGPAEAAVSHASALSVYGISDSNPDTIHLNVPRSARLRREKPKGLVVHYADIAAEDIKVHEGIPVTTVARTVRDLLEAGARIDLIRQAISEARREGYVDAAEARRLRYRVDVHVIELREQKEMVEA